MIVDTNTQMAKAVFKLTCPECSTVSYVGFETPMDTVKEKRWGLIGFSKRQQTLIKPSTSTEDFLHCPACDASSIDFGENAEDWVEEISQPVEVSNE